MTFSQIDDQNPEEDRNLCRISVMLVDDDPVFLKMMETWLYTRHRDEIYVVGSARSGEECLALAQVLAPQVVLIDLQMPGMGGLGTIPLLHILFPQMRILALTHNDCVRTRRMVLAAGGHELISKSVVRSELFPALQRALKIDAAETIEFA